MCKEGLEQCAHSARPIDTVQGAGTVVFKSSMGGIPYTQGVLMECIRDEKCLCDACERKYQAIVLQEYEAEMTHTDDWSSLDYEGDEDPEVDIPAPVRSVLATFYGMDEVATDEVSVSMSWSETAEDDPEW